jgi:hypothetical protein
VPLAPGLASCPSITAGVAHVAGPDGDGHAWPCPPTPAYRPDDQRANLASLTFDDDVFRLRIPGDPVVGDPGFDWTLDFSTDPPSPTRSVAPVTIEVPDLAELRDMVLNPERGLQLYFQGRLQVRGEAIRAVRLPVVAARLRRVPEIVRLLGLSDPSAASPTLGSTSEDAR